MEKMIVIRLQKNIGQKEISLKDVAASIGTSFF